MGACRPRVVNAVSATLGEEKRRGGFLTFKIVLTVQVWHVNSRQSPTLYPNNLVLPAGDVSNHNYAQLLDAHGEPQLSPLVLSHLMSGDLARASASRSRHNRFSAR